ncbi:MAG: adenylyl-sulfate kinase, partial [Nitrospirae bacterium]|nr:adenylyl-sulfate kinase [Nitrospirota bacterium]
DRRLVRTLVEEGEFIEVYLKCPVNVCIERDPKGMYKKAINNQIGSFTGVSDSYEAPQTPEIVIETDKITINEGVEIIIDYLAGKRIINKGIKL